MCESHPDVQRDSRGLQVKSAAGELAVATSRHDSLHRPEPRIRGAQFIQHPGVLIAEINVPVHLGAEFTRPEVPDCRIIVSVTKR